LARAAIEQREELRGVLDRYLHTLQETLEATQVVHEREGGNLHRIIDLHVSIAQVESAKRVMWFENYGANVGTGKEKA